MSKPNILTELSNVSINKNRVLSDGKDFLLKLHADRFRVSTFNENKLSFEVFPDTPEFKALTQIQGLCENVIIKEFNDRHFVSISRNPNSTFWSPDNKMIEKVNDKLMSKMNDIDIIVKPSKYVYKKKEGVCLKIIQVRYHQVYSPPKNDVILFD